MKTTYKTKRDTNGNTYWLTLDHTNRTYTEQYHYYEEAITTTRRQLRELKNEAIENGYTERA